MRMIALAFAVSSTAFIQAALAQSPPAPPPTPQASISERNLALAVQQLINATQLYAEEVNRVEAALRQRLGEVEKLCGEACKPKPPGSPEVGVSPKASPKP